MICLKCNPLKGNSDVATTVSDNLYNYEDIMDAESSSASSLSSSDIIHTPRNKAELLLQAIQRTPKSNKKHKHKSKDSNQMAAIKQPTTINSNSNNIRICPPHNNSNSMNGGNIGVHNSSSISNSSSSSNVINNGVVGNNISNVVGCQLCKRQKTQHNFNQPAAEEFSSDDNNSSLNSSAGNTTTTLPKNKNPNKSSADDDTAGDDDDEGGDNETDGGKTLSSDCVDNVSIVIDGGEYGVKKMSTSDNFNEHEIMEEVSRYRYIITIFVSLLPAIK